MEKNVVTYTSKERNMYLTGMFGQNMIYNIVSTGVYYYFQNIICLPAVAMGWIFTLARIWDAVNDPMMGAIVDRTKSKFGKCRSWLLFAPPVICIITCLCFVNKSYSEAKLAGNSTSMILIVAWAAITYILWGMSYTTGDVPLWGIISRMTEDENDRSILISLSRVVATIGGAVALICIVPVSQAINSALSKSATSQFGFIFMGLTLTIIATILFEFAGIGSRERVPASEEKMSFGKSISLMWKCVPFRRLFISGILRSPFQLLLTVAMTLISYYYCEGNLMNLFTNFKTLLAVAISWGGMFIGMFVAMLISPVLVKHFDIKHLYNIFSGGSAIPFALVYAIYLVAPTSLEKLGWATLLGICLLLAGAGVGMINVCQSIMISDCIDYEEYRTGYRPDGVFFSGQSFIAKFSAGISSIISAYAYAAVGYTDVNVEKMNIALEKGASFAVDYAPYARIMFFLISIPCAIGMFIAILPTLKYEITQKKHSEMLDELVKRHHQEKIETKDEETKEETATVSE